MLIYFFVLLFVKSGEFEYAHNKCHYNLHVLICSREILMNCITQIEIHDCKCSSTFIGMYTTITAKQSFAIKFLDLGLPSVVLYRYIAYKKVYKEK